MLQRIRDLEQENRHLGQGIKKFRISEQACFIKNNDIRTKTPPVEWLNIHNSSNRDLNLLHDQIKHLVSFFEISPVKIIVPHLSISNVYFHQCTQLLGFSL